MRQKRCSDSNDSGDNLWVTRIIDNLGKSRLSLMLKRGILTEIPTIEGKDFYPDWIGSYVSCGRGQTTLAEEPMARHIR